MIFTYLQANLLQRAGQSIVAALRKDLFHHIAKQSMSFFDRHAMALSSPMSPVTPRRLMSFSLRYC